MVLKIYIYIFNNVYKLKNYSIHRHIQKCDIFVQVVSGVTHLDLIIPPLLKLDGPQNHLHVLEISIFAH